MKTLVFEEIKDFVEEFLNSDEKYIEFYVGEKYLDYTLSLLKGCMVNYLYKGEKYFIQVWR